MVVSAGHSQSKSNADTNETGNVHWGWVHTLQTKPGPVTCKCLPDCPTHVRDKCQQRVTDGEGREKGHVCSAVHQSTSIPLLFPMLWTSSSLRQKRDILWILVLLAHCTHIVSVAEDEVLFFLKRGLRVLGGACRKARQNFRGIRGNIFFFSPYNSPISVGPLWQGSHSMHEVMQKFWPWRSVMNDQPRTNLRNLLYTQVTSTPSPLVPG